MSDLFGAPQIATQPPDALPAGEKRARGAYYTPDALALAMTRSVAGLWGYAPPQRILEPGCGGGAFLRAVAATWPDFDDLVGVDLVPACDGPGIVRRADLFNVTGRYHLIIGNPDFSIAERVVRHCMKQLASYGTLALLLRLSFLESSARVPLFAEYPLWAFQPVAQRASFTPGGEVDQIGYGVFVWQDRHRGNGQILPPLVWR